MASRVGRVAVVAGLVALGVTDGASALAEEGSGGSASTEPAAAPRAGKRPPVKKRAVKADPGLVATLPGFEMLPDGGSRLFVELTHTTNVTEKRDARALTYVLQGAHITLRNNENALVTVHFNTPVSRARLLPLRGDLVFSVELRADATPVWRLVDGEGGVSVLQIDFPKGVYLPANDPDAIPSAPLPRPPEASGPDPVHATRRSPPPPAVTPPAPTPPPGPPTDAPASGN